MSFIESLSMHVLFFPAILELKVVNDIIFIDFYLATSKQNSLLIVTSKHLSSFSLYALAIKVFLLLFDKSS